MEPPAGDARLWSSGYTKHGAIQPPVRERCPGQDRLLNLAIDPAVKIEEAFAQAPDISADSYRAARLNLN